MVSGIGNKTFQKMKDKINMTDKTDLVYLFHDSAIHLRPRLLHHHCHHCYPSHHLTSRDDLNRLMMDYES